MGDGNRNHLARSGAIAYQLLVLLVPVILALMGFAVDLGQLYLIKGEIKAAANSAALAAAAKLIGTDVSTSDATAAMRLTLENSTGFGNRYNFNAIPIGDTTGLLTSEAPDPAYFATVSDATATGDSGGGGGSAVSGGTAKYVKVTINADAPLTFWSLLSLGSERKTPITMTAVAGVSAPLCVACAIEPLAIAAADSSDPVDFGFTQLTRYTFGYQCTGFGTPGPLANGGIRIPYLILNHYNDSSTVFPDENQQLYRLGAGGLIGDANSTLACVSMNPEAPETVWVNAAPTACQDSNGNTTQVSSFVTSFTCGLAVRFDASTVSSACPNITDSDTIITAFKNDTDLTDLDDFASYIGNARRIITVAVVDALSTSDPMNILGFRQFLIEPTQNDVTINAGDVNARFAVLYLGSPMPLRQGRIDGCTAPQSAGPGKVVLHQ